MSLTGLMTTCTRMMRSWKDVPVDTTDTTRSPSFRLSRAAEYMLPCVSMKHHFQCPRIAANCAINHTATTDSMASRSLPCWAALNIEIAAADLHT